MRTLVVSVHGFNCSATCRIFPDQGSNLCPLSWQVDSLPLSHRGSPGDSIQCPFSTFYPLTSSQHHEPLLPSPAPQGARGRGESPGEERGGSGSNQACICSSGNWCWGVMAATTAPPPPAECRVPPRCFRCPIAAWSAAADSSR